MASTITFDPLWLGKDLLFEQHPCFHRRVSVRGIPGFMARYPSDGLHAGHILQHEIRGILVMPLPEALQTPERWGWTRRYFAAGDNAEEMLRAFVEREREALSIAWCALAREGIGADSSLEQDVRDGMAGA